MSCIWWNFQVAAEEKKKLDEFFAVNSYVQGSYDTAADFKKLNNEIVKLAKTGANRLFYLALPPSTYESVATMIKATCMSQGWVSSSFQLHTIYINFYLHNLKCWMTVLVSCLLWKFVT